MGLLGANGAWARAWARVGLGQGSDKATMSGWPIGREGIGTASRARVSRHFGAEPGHRIS